VAPPVFKTGLAANIVAGGFDSLPPPPVDFCAGGGKEPSAVAPASRFRHERIEGIGLSALLEWRRDD
jgi:hypothetical protein